MEILHHPVMIGLSVIFALIAAGIWFCSICYVGSDSIFGHYPSGYGSGLIMSIPMLVILTFAVIGLSNIIVSTLYMGLLIWWHLHLKTIRAPRHWYYDNDEPPPVPYKGRT